MRERCAVAGGGWAKRRRGEKSVEVIENMEYGQHSYNETRERRGKEERTNHTVLLGPYSLGLAAAGNADQTLAHTRSLISHPRTIRHSTRVSEYSR